MRTRGAAVGLVLILFVASGAPPVSAMESELTTELAPTPALGLDAAGLTIVESDVFQSVAPAKARPDWDKVTDLVYSHRGDFGYPWIDPSTGAVKLRPVSTLGRDISSGIAADLGLEVKVDSAPSADSVADLEALADDLTRIDPADAPDSGRIWMTEPDHQNNRIILTVDAPSNALMKLLASRFGTRRIAVRIAPMPMSGPTYDRDHDTPKFFGGATITTPGSTGGGCTVAFAWTAAGGAGEMLTAGHCFHSGGSASYPGYPSAGRVTASSEENWSTTTGTTYFTGQSTYRGDLALIRYTTYGSNYYVFDGAIHTATNHKVTAMHSRYLMATDRLTTNGSSGGPFPGIVLKTGINVLYNSSGPNVYARNVASIQPDAGPTACPINGDSGGPTYARNADGTLTAMGVDSGRTTYSGGSCVWYITDIRDAYNGLSGSVLLP